MGFRSAISLFLGFTLWFAGALLVGLSSYVWLMNFSVFIEWEFFGGYTFSFTMTLLGDWVSLSFAGLVLIISGSVMIYSSEYMGSDLNFYRFIILVGLFVLSMVLMILSPNMISVLLGWDGLGLVSYCLVIYYQNAKSASAGMLTILSNRVGDVAILLSIAWLMNFGGWNFFYFQFLYSDYLGLITGLVVLAGMTKSAQIPFSAWLPAAMAAPTPVSALVHSSTLVTAGVYLLIRFNEMLGVNYVLFFLSVLTMLMSGVGANFEMDLKKIIALSTLSQLGVMMMSLSLGMVELAYFHLLTHALFKSLLFLCAGVFIHGSDDTQDIRLMGVVGAVSPLSALFFVGSSMALCGFPFMSGFYSKDLILELVGGLELNLLMWVLLILATFMTIMYSVRLFAFMMVKPTTSSIVGGFMESWSMLAPMSVLFFLSVVGGSTMGWEMAPAVLVVLPSWLSGLILGFMLLFTVAVLISSLSESIRGEGTTMVSGASLVSFWGSMWWLNTFSVNWMVVMSGGFWSMSLLDHGWVEVWGPQSSYTKLSMGSSLVDLFSFVGMKKFIFLFLFLGLVFVGYSLAA